MADDLQKVASEVRDAFIDVQSREYAHQTAYTNLITLGGYGGAFAIWGFSKSILTPHATAAIAMSLGVSLAAFVFFEVYKMVKNASMFLRWHSALQESVPPQEMLSRVTALQSEISRKPFQENFYVWLVQLIIAVSGALIALLLLFYACAATMLGLPLWP